MSRSNILLGSILAGTAGISMAANSTAAKLAYDGGSNPLTYLTLRTAMAAVLVFAIVVLTRRSLRMPLRRRLAAFGIGAVLALYSYGLLAAIEFIPVALAVLTFYTFPLLTSAWTWLSGREKPTVLSVAALIVAFLGLALALDIRGGDLNPAGIALAMMGAIGVTVVMVLNNRLVDGTDSYPVTLNMMLSATVLCVLVTLVMDGYALPQTAQGLTSLFLGTSFYAAGIVTIFLAISLAGAVPTALSLNLEPVASMAFAFLILNQVLSGLQLFGAALVIGAVLSVRLADLRRPDTPANSPPNSSHEARP